MICVPMFPEMGSEDVCETQDGFSSVMSFNL
jgi:hypothetical protein